MTSVLAFFVLICVLVFVHEYGHFWAARKCGVRVLRFSIGFGKVLWCKTDKHGTEFAFSLIPLGGYVKMYGEDPERTFPEHESIANKSVLQRTFIIIAGPLANLLFAIVAYWAVFMAGVPTLKPVIGGVIPQTIAAQAGVVPELQIKQVDGRNVQNWEEVTLALVGKVGAERVEISGTLVDEDLPRTYTLDLSEWQIDDRRENPLTVLGIKPKSSVVEPIIKEIVEQSPAEKLGLKANDVIISINQQPFDWDFLVEQVQTGKPLDLVVEKAGVQHHYQIQPEKSAKENRYFIGVKPTFQPLAEKYRTELKYDMLTAFQKSLEKVGSLFVTIWQFIGKLLTGELSLKTMGGPISIAKGAGLTAEIGWVYYLSFMALISVNLGVMNLFPILPLDGGQLVLLGAEAVRGKPLSENAQLRFQQIGMALVMSLMVVVVFNDLLHF